MCIILLCRAAPVRPRSLPAPSRGSDRTRGPAAGERPAAGPPAPPDVVFLTAGGTGSSHCLVTAVHAGALGARTVLAQFPQPDTDASRAVAAASAARAALVVRARSPAGLPLALLKAWRAARRMGPVRWIPPGGAHPRAVVGHLLAGLELESQLPHLPDAIVTPLGTGGP